MRADSLGVADLWLRTLRHTVNVHILH